MELLLILNLLTFNALAVDTKKMEVHHEQGPKAYDAQKAIKDGSLTVTPEEQNRKQRMQ